MATKMENLRRNAVYTHGCWDAIIFKKIKNLLGGNVRIMVTGSAPMNADVLDFLKCAFCCPIREGYGLTETSAGICMTASDDPTSGHVGGVFPCGKMKLRDIPDMNYLSTDNPPRGEVMF